MQNKPTLYLLRIENVLILRSRMRNETARPQRFDIKKGYKQLGYTVRILDGYELSNCEESLTGLLSSSKECTSLTVSVVQHKHIVSVYV